MNPPLRIAFLHPTLGIGGAERLIIDAARCLQNTGHQVTIFTTEHNHDRCFEDTLSGDLNIEVHDHYIPAHIMQRLRAPLAIARMRHLAYVVSRRKQSYDIVFVDLVAHILPVLKRLLPDARRVFYCHFPDELLTKPNHFLYNLYRKPIHKQETRGMQCAELIFANSQYTRQVVQKTYPRLEGKKIKVLYPGVNLSNADTGHTAATEPDDIASTAFVMLSIARFSPEKNLLLLVESLQALREKLPPGDFKECLLVLAGGYDAAHASNINTYNNLKTLIEKICSARAGNAASLTGSRHVAAIAPP